MKPSSMSDRGVPTQSKDSLKIKKKIPAKIGNPKTGLVTIRSILEVISTLLVEAMGWLAAPSNFSMKAKRVLKIWSSKFWAS